MKLRNRFYIIFLSVSIIPIILITTVAYHQFYSSTYRQMDEYSENIAEKAVEKLDSSFKSISQAANMFTYSSTNSLVQLLHPYADPDSEHSPLTIYQSKQNMKYLCQNILNTYEDIYGFYVFTPSGAILDYENSLYSHVHYGYFPTGKEQWYQDTIELDGTLYVSAIDVYDEIFSNGIETVFFSKYLYDVYSHKFLGVLVINCSPSLLSLDSVNMLPELTNFTLYNEKTDGIIYSTQSKMPLYSSAKAKHQQLITKSLKQSGLTLSVHVDYYQLLREFNYTEILLVALCSVFLVLSFLLSYMFSRTVITPITSLSHVMSLQSEGDLPKDAPHTERSDEIGILYQEYNQMLEKLNASIKTNYQNKLISLDAQMKSLEARINSHFLFNTLACFNSIAEIDGSERISVMSVALGNMFRYAIKTESELVTIRDELNHVQDYITIQSIRYNNRFSLEVSMPDTMLEQNILKLVLQPLVENAFIHGLKNCQIGTMIRISGVISEDSFTLAVTDDGRGMDAKKVIEIQEMLRTDAEFTELGHRSNQSIGLKNIHTRIELYYGKGYGLMLESVLNKGTTLQIKVPRMDTGSR